MGRTCGQDGPGEMGIRHDSLGPDKFSILIYKVHLFQYKSQFNTVYNVNPWNHVFPITFSNSDQLFRKSTIKYDGLRYDIVHQIQRIQGRLALLYDV
jgi:hypothetical protein